MNTSKNTSTTEKSGFFSTLEKFIDKRLTTYFFISLGLLILLSLLLFQVNVSIGGDDSNYILRAYRFYKYGSYPSFQGPLYPIFLTPFIALFGLNVSLLKLLSVLFTAIFFYLFYKAYRNRMSSFVLALSLLLMAVNYQILYYASQTYNEAFHSMIQAFFLIYFFRFYDTLKGRDAELRKDYKGFIYLGLILWLILLSKSVGLTAIISVCGMFFLEKKWKAMTFSLISFTGIYGMYYGIKSLFENASVQFADQGSVLLLKDPYDVAKGNEDFSGFVTRLLENSSAYLSKNILKMLHLRPEDTLVKIDLLTIIIYALIFTGLIIWFKRNKYLFFTGLFMTVTFLVTFVIVQTRWDSDRLIFILLPSFIIFNLSTIKELIGRLKARLLQPVFFILTLLFIFSNFSHSTGKIDLLRIKKNLAGDKYLGYTPDWQNYLKMSEWTAKNLPEGSYVACRKGGMSSIYAGGKEFHNITRVFSTDADTLLNALQENGVTHVIMARLRRNPKVKSEYTINTVQRYLYYIEMKYPGTFTMVYQEGATNNEEANLFVINYDVRERMLGVATPTSK